jgi:hypothetical protein
VAEKILLDHHRPTRQSYLTAFTNKVARTLDVNLVAEKADLSPGSAPTMSLPMAAATKSRLQSRAASSFNVDRDIPRSLSRCPFNRNPRFGGLTGWISLH